ncbi:MAG: NADH-quinone oxidoreductase subunit C [Dehalococcoidia bacterium]|nr:MAG: NADH-quinone oxidoreductase subunit C [Dehalococcoidia bacterium]
MTTMLNIDDIAARLKAKFGKGISPANDCLEVTPTLLPQVAEYLKTTPGMDFDFLDMVTAVDYADRFEMVYRLLSTRNNSLVSIKVKCDKAKPVVPSLANLWQGASLQEREIYDLLGIEFSGHPDMRRIVLWEGYQGHPLRKDFKDRVYGAGN